MKQAGLASCMRRKWLKIILGGLLILMLIPVILYVSAWIFKPLLLPKLNRALSEKAGGKVVIKEMDFTLFDDFPNLSLSLTEPSVAYVPGKEVFKAAKVDVQLQLWPLLRKSFKVNTVMVKDGRLQLIRSKNGKTNFEGLTQSTGSSTPKQSSRTDFIIRRLLLQNVLFQYLDEEQNKEHCFTLHKMQGGMIPIDSSSSLVTFQGPVYFKGLAFNADQGAFFAKREASLQFQWVYSPNTQRIEFRNSFFEANDQHFAVTGGFRFQQGTWIDIQLRNAEVRLNKLRPLLSPTISKALAKYQTDDPLAARLVMKGNLATGETPDIDVVWQTKKMDLKAFSMQFSNLAMQGKFMNYVNPDGERNDANSRVHISPLMGKLLGTSFRAAVTVNNLTDPSIRIKTDSKFSKFPFPQLTKLISPKKIKVEGGPVSLLPKQAGMGDLFLNFRRKAVAQVW